MSNETENTTATAEPASGESLPELTLGAGGPSDGSSQTAEEHTIRGKIDKFGVAMGTGRRKTAVARIRIKRGNGKTTVNGRTLEDYCRVERDRINVEAPLRATDMLGKVDIWVRVEGGGPTGQAGAMVLGIARALQTMDPTLHARLSEGGYL